MIVCDRSQQGQGTISGVMPSDDVSSNAKPLKIDLESVLGGAPGLAKSMPGPSWEAVWHLRVCRNAAGASRDRPGASPAWPGSTPRVRKEAPVGQKEQLGVPGSAPRRAKSMSGCFQDRKKATSASQGGA